MRSWIHILVLASAYALTLGGLSYLAWRGWSYYSTPLIERPRHADYWVLKPGGSLGHAFGVAGASLMTLMYLYSVRKRWTRVRNWGRLSAWLDFHIYCGITGPLLILLHSSLKVKGLVSVSFWSMVAVVASGVLGRYLYVQIPRRRSGDELSLRELEELAANQSQQLSEVFGLSDDLLRSLDMLVVSEGREHRSLFEVAWRLPFEPILLRLRLAHFWRQQHNLPADSKRNVQLLILARAQLRRRIRFLGSVQELFHYWHVFHKPFAVIMYIFMVAHIGVAIAIGYGWGSG